MKRFVALLAVAILLAVLPAVGPTEPADAAGYGGCAITGTMTFSSKGDNAGTWRIGPAVIDCQGLIAARRRIIGRGNFQGSGTFTAIAPADGGCLQQNGVGKVDYRIPTTGGDIVIDEEMSHTLAGVGTLSTPTLRGIFQLPPPYNGDCITKPVGRTSFVAEVALVRYPRNPLAPIE